MIWAIILAALLILLGLFFSSVLSGAPFEATQKRKIKDMLKLADLRRGEKLVDLGAGNGKIIETAAEKGAWAVGYEINSFLVLKAHRHLPPRAKLLWRNFWLMPLSGFDVVTVYGISHIMKPLGRKLARELKVGTRIVSYRYPLPNFPLVKKKDDIYLYIKK